MMKEYVILGSERQKKTVEWRQLFSPENLQAAQDPSKILEVRLMQDKYSSSRCKGTVTAVEPGTRGKEKIKFYTVMISGIPEKYSDTWSEYHFSCSCTRTGYLDRSLCSHVAAAMFQLEKERGGAFVVQEGDWEYDRRMRQEKRYQNILNRREEMKQGSRAWFPVSKILEVKQSELVLYDLAGALKHYTTSAWAAKEAKRIGTSNVQIRENEERNGTKHLTAEYSAWDDDLQTTIRCNGLFTAKRFDSFRCSCDFHEISGIPGEALCPHQLVVAQGLRNYIQHQLSTDLTDDAAREFFARLHSAQKQEEKRETGKEPEKTKDILLSPRIVVENGEAQVSFKIGRKGGKMLILRNLKELLGAYTGGKKLATSKTETLDFAKQDFVPEASPWLIFIQRRVTEIQDVNEKIYNKTNSWHRPTTLSVTAQQPLYGAVLDQFYELAEGQLCEYADKSNEVKGLTIAIGHTKMRFSLNIDQIVDTAGTFAGITVSGMIPVMLEGASASYILNQSCLSRMEQKEMDVLSPFRAVADPSGLFRFRVGRDHLQEFYYRVLPNLLENPFVSIVDRSNGEPQKYLPPEPQFSFYLDLTEDGRMICRCHVSYLERIVALNSVAIKGEYRDEDQEKRIRGMLKEEFDQYDPAQGIWFSRMTDDRLYDFLVSGIGRLEKYGTVNGTEAFKRRTVRRFSPVQVGVAVKSGLMDITVTSRDYSPHELLAILDSYQKKKRYYRLKSGDFVDLTDDSELADLLAFFGGMDLVPADALKKNIHLPLYRALYLDRMLEEHNGLAATRDRTYRALIKNFQTIRDADYEVPRGLEEVLRPYQTFGYKWLKTLEDAGFGGILADDMGLGKTIQMISVFQNDRENGCSLPSLVICPASLVYNWQAEINRFAPELQVKTVTGTTAVRKSILVGINSISESDLSPETQSAETGNSEASASAKAREGAGITLSEGTAELHGSPEGVASLPKKRGRKPKTTVIPLSSASAESLAVSLPEADIRGKRRGNDEKASGKADVYITSYDLLKRDIALYEDLHFQCCVLDEAQFIKNQNAAVTKSVKLIHADHRFALTGTPIENRLSELWSIFDYLMPGFLFRSEEFVKRFEQPISRSQDEEATARLKKMVSPFILRRLKTDVLKDLPPKLEEVRYARMEGEQQKLYDAQVAHMTRMIKAGGYTGEDKIRILAELTHIRQICCDPSLLFENFRGESAKRTACMELVESAIDGGHRMLIFSQFTSMLSLLEEDLNAAGIAFYKITGATPKETRISLVNQFNEGDTPVFLVSLKAGGTGLNLTGADVVIHYDPWWNLAAQNQATDRAHRIGQNKQVTVYKMIVKDTIEEKILELQEAKQDLADAILEGRSESLMSLSNEELLALLNG